MLQGNHGGKGSCARIFCIDLAFFNSQWRAEPKKGTQHEPSLAENFSEPIGLKTVSPWDSWNEKA